LAASPLPFFFAWFVMASVLPIRASQHNTTDLRTTMNQLAFPSAVTPQEIDREKTLGGAIELCAKAAGREPKEIMDAIRVDGKALDKAQWSRWKSGEEGVVWPKLVALMDVCGNDAPLLWMLQARGYDLHSLRRQESETEKALRIAKEELAKERAEREVERRLFREMRVAA
jgi:hypothetical protein